VQADAFILLKVKSMRGCITSLWNLENTYAKLPGLFYRSQKPTVVCNPQIAVLNHGLAKSLGLDTGELTAEILAGSELPGGANPISQAYAGYQFGHFSLLGDGRAVLLGEQVTPKGRRFDVQLKGSGRTPFSRNGDGLAALGPMLREYIISEAMFHLGIPTTRSLAVVATGEKVCRERILPGAVLTRVASSHIRVGTFDYVSAYGTADDLRKLADYSIGRHFPELSGQEEKYLLFLREVCKLQASLIAKWQLIGFVHGVMNTDNMTISGETIDYGPCAFMDEYDPDTVFSSIDTEGRYAYSNQPVIGAWNLCRLAESLLPLLGGGEDAAIESAQGEIERYWDVYNEHWLDGMRDKLGITEKGAEDAVIAAEVSEMMKREKLDFTKTFRAISLKNPAVIPRNYYVEETLAAAERGDYSVMNRLLEALRNPYEESEMYSPVPQKASCGYKTFCGT
jgi:uncharacterized protein YdiU (UPF0061 family)